LLNAVQKIARRSRRAVVPRAQPSDHPTFRRWFDTWSKVVSVVTATSAFGAFLVFGASPILVVGSARPIGVLLPGADDPARP
jgi:hypothetical protein